MVEQGNIEGVDASSFSKQTLSFLKRFGDDLVTAVDAAPDAELQQISEGYRNARATLSEADAKGLMLGLKPQPVSKRHALLTGMAKAVTDPGLKAFVDSEIQRERVIQEHLRLMDIAERNGDDELADELAARLRAHVGIDQMPELEVPADEPINQPAMQEEVPAEPETEPAMEPEMEPAPEEVAPEPEIAEQAADQPPPDVDALADKLRGAWGAQ